MTKVKLWISDIDGTIMNYDGSYTKEMEEVIRKINNKNDTKLVIATGRMFMGAEHAARQFDIKTPVVCYQGAVVRTKNEILWQAPVKDELVPEIIDYLRKENIHTHIYFNDTLYIEDNNKKIMDEYCNGRGTTYEVVESFDELEIKNCAKILAVIYDENLMKKIKANLTQKYQGILTIVQSAGMYLEITDKNASKGNALNFLKQYWNLSDDEIIASGDQDNDIEMLKNAGHKVCVGNHSKALKEVANYHCKDVNSNELVKIIERLMLCE